MIISMRKYFLLILISLFSCRNGDGDKKTSTDTIIGIGDTGVGNNGVYKENDNNIKDTITVKSSKPEIDLPPIDTSGNAERSVAIKKMDIQIKTFQNTEVGGFGYDILMDGHMYVHQPTIPALPGNNGFATVELARKVAELVTYKIRHNILPPTLEVKELDSLGVK